MALGSFEISALAKAALDNDRKGVLDAVRLVAAKAPANLARALQAMLRESGAAAAGSRAPSLDSLILPEGLVKDVGQFLLERRHAAKLVSDGVLPSNRILLVGPPGNGKTSFAMALAAELGISCVMPMIDRTFESYMGQTGGNLAKSFAMAENNMLFLDEFEAFGRERDHLGPGSAESESARITAGLLERIDCLSWRTILVCATNHQQMLDRAARRRFDLVLEFPAPDGDRRERFLKALAGRFEVEPDFFSDIGGDSFSDLETMALRKLRGRLIEKYESL